MADLNAQRSIRLGAGFAQDSECGQGFVIDLRYQIGVARIVLFPYLTDLYFVAGHAMIWQETTLDGMAGRVNRTSKPGFGARPPSYREAAAQRRNLRGATAYSLNSLLGAGGIESLPATTGNGCIIPVL